MAASASGSGPPAVILGAPYIVHAYMGTSPVALGLGAMDLDTAVTQTGAALVRPQDAGVVTLVHTGDHVGKPAMSNQGLSMVWLGQSSGLGGDSVPPGLTLSVDDSGELEWTSTRTATSVHLGVHWDTTSTSSPLHELTKYTARISVGARGAAPVGVLGGTLVTPGACSGGTFMDAAFPQQCNAAAVRFTLTALSPHAHVAAPGWLAEKYPELLTTPWWGGTGAALRHGAPRSGWGRHRGYTRNPLAAKNTKWGFNAVAAAHGMNASVAPAPVLLTPLYYHAAPEVVHHRGYKGRGKRHASGHHHGHHAAHFPVRDHGARWKSELRGHRPRRVGRSGSCGRASSKGRYRGRSRNRERSMSRGK